MTVAGILGLGFRAYSLGLCWDQGFGFRILGLGFRARFRARGLGVHSPASIHRIWGIWGSRSNVGQLHILSTQGGLQGFRAWGLRREVSSV